MTDISGAHRGVIGFARGGVAALAIMIAAPVLAGWLRHFGALLQPGVSLMVAFSLPSGLAVGGMLGVSSLCASGRSVVGSAAGFFAAGLVLSWALPNLQGLTGREPAAAVVPYAMFSFAAAFGIAGGVGGWALQGQRRIALAGASGFAAGGAIGGALLVTPFLLARGGVVLGPDDIGTLASLATVAAAILVPFVVGGAVLGRELESQGMS